jgi:hypothetical protein
MGAPQFRAGMDYVTRCSPGAATAAGWPMAWYWKTGIRSSDRRDVARGGRYGGGVQRSVKDAARVTMQLMIGMAPRSLPLAFAPAGDRILYLQSRGPPSLWIATISDRGLSDIRRLFTEDSHFAIDGATW